MRRTPRLAAAAALTALMTGLAAPAAIAASTPTWGWSVSPGTVAPGGQVTLSAHGCPVPTVTVSSGVFDTVTLNEGRPAKARVDWDAKPGAQYTVTFKCQKQTGTVELTIASNRPVHPVHPVHPVGPVNTGLGGGTSGMNAAELTGGALLLTAAVGTVVLRRRRADGRV
ncbi:hypothetical protein [Streptacidiphilus albus]|uniref:hypothetical protein n=1 Tax=Streptacidiphilus albus TaxID=105425 RepID=UPI00054C717C|nr:hypothetical protein [Streptacidiphilus albus]